RASTRSSRSTCTCRAARRAPRRCSRAWSCCSSGSATRTWPPSGATRSTRRSRHRATRPSALSASRSSSEVAGLSDTDVASTDAAPAELPGDGLREGIVDDLRAAIGDGLIVVHLVPQDDLWVRVAPEAWADTAVALRDMGFHYFCFLSAIDWLPSPYGTGENDPDAEAEEP